ncbi:MAG: alpha/beta hydrolase [Candidatus Binatia bacterium]
MPSPQHEAIVAMLQSQPLPAEIPTPEVLRAFFEAMASTFPVPDGVKCTPAQMGGVPGEWIEMPGASADRVVLYLHGGGYVIGSLNTHRSLVARIARESRARCFSLDYRLAPEHAYPAAVEDAVAAYRGLVASGIAPERIVVAGDSAGGGLTLATLLSLRDAGDTLPAAAVCLSPWADLEGTGGSHADPDIHDPMVNLPGLQLMGQMYAGTSVRDPLASPLHADFRGLPPLYILVGTREMLLDDSLRVADKARAAGVPVLLEKGLGLIHVWPMFGDDVPEAAEAVKNIGAFVRTRVG